jgi:predicted permease
VVWPGYFKTLGIPLLRGRDFSARDGSGNPHVAIVNEAAAAAYWPGDNPVGRRIQFAGEGLPVEVIGVARNANYQTIGERPQALVYLSLIQYYFPTAVIYVRTTGAPEAALATVRREVQALDRNLLLQAESIRTTIRDSLWAQRASATLLAIFGLLALLLSAIGLYGVISYSVNQRVREIGLRMALGATTIQVEWMILTEGIQMVTIGVLSGLAIALGASRLVSGMLIVVSPRDVLTFVLVPAILMLVAVLACWVPAHRATRIDPVTALRDE